LGFSEILFCFADGEIEIQNALKVEFKVVVRASAVGVERYEEKTFEFIQPTDNTSEDWHIGRIIMREKTIKPLEA